ANFELGPPGPANNSTGPGSPIARTLVTPAARLALDDFFDGQLLRLTRRR
ncbi:MAG TPA: hypothetical protein VFQ42_05660, partial [Mycobacterium sp.]|nr:hypothetical protein [Mycobacterium sp.]